MKYEINYLYGIGFIVLFQSLEKSRFFYLFLFSQKTSNSLLIFFYKLFFYLIYLLTITYFVIFIYFKSDQFKLSTNLLSWKS